MVDFMDIFTVKNALRLLIFVFLFGYSAFSLLLSLRVRILAQTLKTPRSALVATFAKLHLVMVVIGSIIVGILVLF